LITQEEKKIIINTTHQTEKSDRAFGPNWPTSDVFIVFLAVTTKVKVSVLGNIYD